MDDIPSAPVSRGFQFTQRMREVCADMVARLPELSHIHLDRVAISFSQARKRGSYGIHATLTPMRFEGGREEEIRYGQLYRCQRLFDSSGQEFLYILSFYLPRFLDAPLEEKLVTILHELWHISPFFDGDFRRFAGRCYAHSHSQQQYDDQMLILAKKWLAKKPPHSLYGFLEYSFDQLAIEHRVIYGTKIRHPKLITVDSPLRES